MLIALLDGSFLADASAARGGYLILRLLDAEIEPVPAAPPVAPMTGLSTARRTRLRGEVTHQPRRPIEDMDVVGESLAALLERALATDGGLPVPIKKLAKKDCEH